jgi:DNA repair exonuclease SbcCD ATPase subunit
MQIQKIVLKNFMSHHETEVLLPEKGIVLITGPNGSGKSSLIEAVSVGLWGKTLRGTTPWTQEDGEVKVYTNSVSAIRGKVGTKINLLWFNTNSVEAEEKVNFASTTKAQEALENVIGSHWVWQRTHVLSASDIACFTQSTDSERKRLLEAFIGIEKFDAALEECRGDLRNAEVAIHKAENGLIIGTARKESAHKLLELSEDILKSFEKTFEIEDLAELNLRLTRLTQADKSNFELLTKLRAERKAIDENVMLAELNLKSTTKCFDVHLNSAICPTCDQKIPPDFRAKAQLIVEAKRLEVQQTKAATKASMLDNEAQRAELESESKDIKDALQEIRERISKANSLIEEKARYDTQRAGAIGRKEKAVIDEKAAIEFEKKWADILQAVTVDFKELEVAEKVLGTKGVRAHVLGATLAAISEMANTWLRRIAGDNLRLRLSAYQEKKSGGVSDSISLEIDGAGGGHGYKASSAGERRRIDVALLFALSEIASVAHGTPAGTLFVDECFDGLDAEGVPRVVEAVQELSAQRLVVVISHDENLKYLLDSARHLKIKDGKFMS